MTNFEIWLLAVSLAMDCFTVSVTSGIITRRVEWRTFLPIAFIFGFFQAMMPLLGWFGANHFSHLIEDYDHWIAFSLLFLLGAKMIKDYFQSDKKLCFNPRSMKVILTLGVATSIDALAVGISFAFTGFKNIQSMLYPLFVIGFASFVLSIGGSLIGVIFGLRFKLRMELWAGIVLIAIGTKILIEHLYFNH